jgi:ABC-type nitrate/sulfonate/bicarbonate transport system substrate-binding protein
MHKELSMFRTLIVGILVFAFIPSAVQAEMKPLRVGYQTGVVNVLLTYGVGSGLFARHGLDVQLEPFPAGPAMLPAFAADQIDIAWMGEFPAVTGFANGLPIEMLMLERLERSSIRLLAKPETNATTAADLKGKRVAATLGSSSHYHLLQALDQAAMSQSDITLVNLGPANMPPAYSADQIDAAFTWEPNSGIIQAEGANVVATTESLGLITAGVWVARKAMSQDHEETVLAFLAAWRDAQEDYLTDPDAVEQFEAQRIGQTPEEFRALIERMGILTPSYELLLTSEYMGEPGNPLESRLARHLQEISDFLLSQGRIDKAPDNDAWTGLINTSPIQKILSKN